MTDTPLKFSNFRLLQIIINVFIIRILDSVHSMKSFLQIFFSKCFSVYMTLLLMQSGSALAFDPAFDQWKIIGAYLAATDMSLKMKQSVCGYALKKREMPSLKSRIAEVRSYLTSNDLSEFNLYVNSPEFSKKMSRSKEIIDDVFIKLKNEGYDDQTACGLLVGFNSSSALKAENDWREMSKR